MGPRAGSNSDGPVWERGGWSPLPVLETEVSADVCVVGLGGSGLSCIAELLRLGASVVGVDAGDVACGAAGRNGGFLLAGTARFHHDAVHALGRERAARIYDLTLAEIDRIEAQAPGTVRRTGSLRIASSDDELADCEAQLAAMRADGLPAEAYAGPEGRGLLFPADASFDPLRRSRVLAGSVSRLGARLYGGSKAHDLSPGRVETARGRIRCGTVIAAVDGRLERLFPELRGRVRTARLQMLATRPIPERLFPRPVYSRWGYEYWQQLPDGRVVLGGFRDRCGAAEWTADSRPSALAQTLLERFLRSQLGVRAPVSHRWAASVGFTPGTLPILEEVRPGVIALGGYNGTGNVIGSICGRAAAQIAVLGGSPLAMASNG